MIVHTMANTDNWSDAYAEILHASLWKHPTVQYNMATNQLLIKLQTINQFTIIDYQFMIIC